mgnify:CR=1 FL=1
MYIRIEFDSFHASWIPGLQIRLGISFSCHNCGKAPGFAALAFFALLCALNFAVCSHLFSLCLPVLTLSPQQISESAVSCAEEMGGKSSKNEHTVGNYVKNQASLSGCVDRADSELARSTRCFPSSSSRIVTDSRDLVGCTCFCSPCWPTCSWC